MERVQCCRLTLLLGPPGCGKTTFLLALAGKLNSSSLKVVIFVVSTSVKKKKEHFGVTICVDNRHSLVDVLIDNIYSSVKICCNPRF